MPRRLIRKLGDSELEAREALRALERRVRPDFKRAVGAAIIAIAALCTGDLIGGPHAHSMHVRWIVYGCAALLVIFGILATRLTASELARVSEARAGASTATPIRVLALLFGYLIVVLAVLDMLDVAIEKLLVGGAITGVVVGIAAQQSLGNVFAGLVLLFARPYVPGERILIRSGALGGPYEGTVTTVGLLYTTVTVDDTIVNIPNSGLLAAAVGPAPATPVEEEPTSTVADEGDGGADSASVAAAAAGIAAVTSAQTSAQPSPSSDAAKPASETTERAAGEDPTAH
ncbi:MAG: mechanosensitive ion channel family protein [Actinobacteria bacterium]|nr:mechanosensitive ion channel family protein [Actinomycetota bacterium]